MNIRQPIALVILDGFGTTQAGHHNAISQAKKPCFDYLLSHYPHTNLLSSGCSVGLPHNWIGNSQVGHLTIGSGRVTPQSLTQIDQMISDSTFFTHPVLTTYLNKLSKDTATLHIMGLLSDAGVHSHINHLYACIQAARNNHINTIIVHPFLDGRDVSPQSAALYLQELSRVLNGIGVIGSIHGRFYAMDRDTNYNRTLQSYNALTSPVHDPYNDWQTLLKYYYSQGITDEFIPPSHLATHQPIKKGDGVIFYNFRPDRARQLAACFVNPLMTEQSIAKIDLTFFITPVAYSSQVNTDTLLPPASISNTLKEVLNAHKKRIFTIAETEKYAHVTYFFDGYKEECLPYETRTLVPSIKTKTYYTHPAMAAPTITKQVIHSLANNPADFYLINYANADMVGHSGSMAATIQAIECLDEQLAQLYTTLKKMGGILLITSDHGKAEDMFDPITGQPRTAHTNNPVPFIVIAPLKTPLPAITTLKELADIAPYILQIMHLPIPIQMRHKK